MKIIVILFTAILLPGLAPLKVNEPAPAIIENTGEDEILVTFDQPQRAITPGQAAVFYDGDIVVGGGWIS